MLLAHQDLHCFVVVVKLVLVVDAIDVVIVAVMLSVLVDTSSLWQTQHWSPIMPSAQPWHLNTPLCDMQASNACKLHVGGAGVGAGVGTGVGAGVGGVGVVGDGTGPSPVMVISPQLVHTCGVVSQSHLHETT